MNELSAVIITRNEEKNLAACIRSLAGVADEVIVVDAPSQDNTADIARQLGARVVIAEVEGYGPRRNYGAGIAKHELILAIDADERLSEALKVSILAVKTAAAPASAYSFNWLNHIGQRAVKTCGWYPDRHSRLYFRKQAAWDEREVHEKLQVIGETAQLEGDMLHYSYTGFAQMKEKTSIYAGLAASLLKSENHQVLAVKMLINPLLKFLKAYFLQLGFTDGHTGFMLSYYKARETFLKYYLALQ